MAYIVRPDLMIPLLRLLLKVEESTCSPGQLTVLQVDPQVVTQQIHIHVGGISYRRRDDVRIHLSTPHLLHPQTRGLISRGGVIRGKKAELPQWSQLFCQRNICLRPFAAD